MLPKCSGTECSLNESSGECVWNYEDKCYRTETRELKLSNDKGDH